MVTLPLSDSTVRTHRRLKPAKSCWDRFLVELLDRQLDREDIEFAREVLRNFRAGVDFGLALSQT